MAEYIDREVALKELNKNSITKKITLANGASIFDTIKNIPTADVVEVVRCKDCFYCIVNENHPDKPLICLMTKMCGTTHPEWFCADGKKKEGAKNGT